MKSYTTDMPANVCLIKAKFIRVGDRVRFRMPSADYTVEKVETDSIGNVKHRFNDDTATNSYHPGEMLWVTRRAKESP